MHVPATFDDWQCALAAIAGALRAASQAGRAGVMETMSSVSRST